jgi:hypothetical protein
MPQKILMHHNDFIFFQISNVVPLASASQEGFRIGIKMAISL